MTAKTRRSVNPTLACGLRRWARRWLGAAIVAGGAVAVVRFVRGGPTLHDWEPYAIGIALTALVVGAALAWLSEPLAGAWLALVGVVGGVAVAAHYGPYMGLAPVIALLPPAVLLLLAWQHDWSRRAVALSAVALVAIVSGGGWAAFAAYDAVFGPSHPPSATPPPALSSVAWMWAGAVDTNGFTVVAQINAGGPAQLLVGPASGESWEPVATSAQHGGIVRLVASGLESATAYSYVVETSEGLGPIGNVSTFPDGAADVTIAFSSCARLGSNGSVFDAIASVSPDVYIVTGDLFYGDIGPNDPDAFRDAYADALSQPAQSSLYRSTPIAYVWDDHDYSQNDGDATAPSRPAAMAVYRELVPHYELAAVDAPIFQAFTIGRVRVIMTDTRSARDPSRGTALGKEQLEWFEAELVEAARRYPLVLWVNPDPWIAAADPGADHWGGYAEERRHIAELIVDLDMAGLLMLSGDAHMVAIDDGTHNTYGAGEPGFVVFHAGALDRRGSVKGGPYSEGAFPGGGQFGVVEISDDGSDIEVRLVGRDWEGREIVSASYVVEGAGD